MSPVAAAASCELNAPSTVISCITACVTVHEDVHQHEVLTLVPTPVVILNAHPLMVSTP